MKKTRIISFLLSLSMLFSLTPLDVFASDMSSVQTGLYDKVIKNDSLKLVADVTSPGAIASTEFKFDSATGTITGYKTKDVPVNLTIPSEIEGVTVKHIGKNAFQYSSSSYDAGKYQNKPLESLVLPEGLETIEKMAFQGSIFTDIEIPSTVKEINGGFRLCKNLSVVKFKADSQLKKLGEDAFYETSLDSITLPEGLEEIGATAFANSRLKSIVIPDSVKIIGKSAFQLSLLEEFSVPSNIEKLNGGTETGGLFYRNFDDSAKQNANLRLTKVYDSTGIATALNTRGIVNPVSVKIKYINEDTKEEIKSSDIAVGKELKKIVMVPGTYGSVAALQDGDGSYVIDYKTPSDRYELYTKFFTEISANYFTKNQEVTFAAPEIPGFTAPQDIKATLDKNVNEIVFSYKPAGNAKLTLEGEGLTSSIAAGDIGIGATVTLTISPPANKQIDSFKINSVDKTTELKSTGITSSYTLKITEDTLVKVEYKEASYQQEFKIQSDKTQIKLGEKAKIKAFYRDIAVSMPNEEVVWTLSHEDIASLDTNTGEVTSLKSGTVVLKAALKNKPEINDEITLVINPVKVKVRVEADYITLLQPTEVEVTDLDLSKYNITAKFQSPKAIHAIVKALAENKGTTGIDPADKKQFDAGSAGSYISKIGSYGVSGNSGWMFYIDNQYVNVSVADRTISDGESINLWRIDTYMENTYVYFENEVYNAEPDKDLTVKIKGAGVDMWTGKPVDANVEGITILNDTDPMTDAAGKYYTTDKEGNVTLKFAVPGTYHLSAMKTNYSGELVISRPYAVVNIKEQAKSSEASLSSLKYDQTDIKLAENQNTYEIKLPKETAKSPVVTATAKDSKATVDVKQADVLPGQATITVTAEDGTTTKEYYVKFVLEEEIPQEKITVEYHLPKSLALILNSTKNPEFGYEWNILCLARGNYEVPDKYYESYYNDVCKQLKEGKGVLSSSKYTEYSRLTLALTAIGRDATSVGGYNLLEKLDDYPNVIKQGVNGSVYALIAIDSHNYEMPKPEKINELNTRDKLIRNILDNEINKGDTNAGGWSFKATDSTPDTDMTAMAIQALAPYYNKNVDVKSAIDRALEWLSKNQKENGCYESWGSCNSESVSQVITALTKLGINPDTDARFVKKDNSLIDALLSFAVPEGGFRNVIDDKEANSMATEQGTYALIAYDRFIKGKTSLYDMSDITLVKEETEEPSEREIVLPEGQEPTVNIPSDIKDCKVSIKPEDISKKIKIIIPSDKTSKVIMNLSKDAELPFIEANKGDVSAVIPKGIKVVEGDISALEMITTMDTKDSEVIKKVESSVPSGKKLNNIDELFSMGGSKTVLFSDYITLTFKGLKGKEAAYIQGDNLYLIQKYSSEDEGKLSGKQEYAYDYGDDLIVKTKHFTEFLAYTLSSTSQSGGETPTVKKHITLSIDKNTIGKGYVLKPLEVEFTEGETAWDVLKKEADKQKIDLKYVYSKQYKSIYIQSIDGDGEFDHGSGSGWMYNVNGKYPNYGSSNYVLKDKDVIQWRYTTNYGIDIGADKKQWDNINQSEDAGNNSGKTDNTTTVNDTSDNTLATDNVYKDSDLISSWAFDFIKRAAEKQFISGYDGKFNPKGNITRSQFTKIITNIIGLDIKIDNSINFSDVNENDWFYPYVNAAYKANIVEGAGTTFRPDENITREQMAIMIVRGLNITPVKSGTVIKDMDNVSDWAREYVETAVALGLMTGDDGYFSPHSYATREMATVAAMRSYDYRNK